MDRTHLLAAADAATCTGSSSAKLSSAAAAGDGELLWVAGLREGLATAPAPDLVAMRLSSLLPLLDHDVLGDDELLAALARRRLPFRLPDYALELLLHAVVPATHVDLTCPDPVMAICDASAGARLARECFGASAAWIPFEREALACTRSVGAAASGAGVRLALLEKRGLLTWGASAEVCHAATLAATTRATTFVASRSWGPACGGRSLAPPSARRRRALLARLLPLLRRELGGALALEIDVSPALVDFLCARDAPLLAQAGPVCPRQVPLTRRLPLWIDWDPAREDAGDLAERVVRGLGRYRARARWEAAVCGRAGAALVDPAPRVVLLGGIGMVVAGPTSAAARRIARSYLHAVAVMTGAAAIDRFVPPTALECGGALPELHASSPP